MGELIVKIINGQIEDIAEPYSPEIRQLVLEMLDTDCDKRPNINEILQKPYILRYIKLNLIKQMDLNQSTKENSKDLIEMEEDYIKREGFIDIENITFKKDEKLKIEYDHSNEIFKSNSLCNININNKIKNNSNHDDYKKLNKGIMINKDIKIDGYFTLGKIEKTKKVLEKLIGVENFFEAYKKINVL
jgi:serine/threonine protein kinase